MLNNSCCSCLADDHHSTLFCPRGWIISPMTSKEQVEIPYISITPSVKSNFIEHYLHFKYGNCSPTHLKGSRLGKAVFFSLSLLLFLVLIIVIVSATQLLVSCMAPSGCSTGMGGQLLGKIGRVHCPHCAQWRISHIFPKSILIKFCFNNLSCFTVSFIWGRVLVNGTNKMKKC